MSGTLYYKPMTEGGALDGTAFKDVSKALEEVFGDMPIVIGAKDYATVKAMMAAASPSDAKTYKHILELLGQYECIQISFVG